MSDLVDFDEGVLALATSAESSTFVPYSGATLFWRGVSAWRGTYDEDPQRRRSSVKEKAYLLCYNGNGWRPKFSGTSTLVATTLPHKKQ